MNKNKSSDLRSQSSKHPKGMALDKSDKGETTKVHVTTHERSHGNMLHADGIIDTVTTHLSKLSNVMKAFSPHRNNGTGISSLKGKLTCLSLELNQNAHTRPIRKASMVSGALTPNNFKPPAVRVLNDPSISLTAIEMKDSAPAGARKNSADPKETVETLKRLRSVSGNTQTSIGNTSSSEYDKWNNSSFVGYPDRTLAGRGRRTCTYEPMPGGDASGRAADLCGSSIKKIVGRDQRSGDSYHEERQLRSSDGYMTSSQIGGSNFIEIPARTDDSTNGECMRSGSLRSDQAISKDTIISVDSNGRRMSLQKRQTSEPHEVASPNGSFKTLTSSKSYEATSCLPQKREQGPGASEGDTFSLIPGPVRIGETDQVGDALGSKCNLIKDQLATALLSSNWIVDSEQTRGSNIHTDLTFVSVSQLSNSRCPQSTQFQKMKVQHGDCTDSEGLCYIPDSTSSLTGGLKYPGHSTHDPIESAESIPYQLGTCEIISAGKQDSGVQENSEGVISDACISGLVQRPTLHFIGSDNLNDLREKNSTASHRRSACEAEYSIEDVSQAGECIKRMKVEMNIPVSAASNGLQNRYKPNHEKEHKASLGVLHPGPSRGQNTLQEPDLGASDSVAASSGTILETKLAVFESESLSRLQRASSNQEFHQTVAMSISSMKSELGNRASSVENETVTLPARASLAELQGLSGNGAASSTSKLMDHLESGTPVMGEDHIGRHALVDDPQKARYTASTNHRTERQRSPFIYSNLSLGSYREFDCSTTFKDQDGPNPCTEADEHFNTGGASAGRNDSAFHAENAGVSGGSSGANSPEFHWTRGSAIVALEAIGADRPLTEFPETENTRSEKFLQDAPMTAEPVSQAMADARGNSRAQRGLKQPDEANQQCGEGLAVRRREDPVISQNAPNSLNHLSQIPLAPENSEDPSHKHPTASQKQLEAIAGEGNEVSYDADGCLKTQGDTLRAEHRSDNQLLLKHSESTEIAINTFEPRMPLAEESITRKLPKFKDPPPYAEGTKEYDVWFREHCNMRRARRKEKLARGIALCDSDLSSEEDSIRSRAPQPEDFSLDDRLSGSWAFKLHGLKELINSDLQTVPTATLQAALCLVRDRNLPVSMAAIELMGVAAPFAAVLEEYALPAIAGGVCNNVRLRKQFCSSLVGIWMSLGDGFQLTDQILHDFYSYITDDRKIGPSCSGIICRNLCAPVMLVSHLVVAFGAEATFTVSLQGAIPVYLSTTERSLKESLYELVVSLYRMGVSKQLLLSMCPSNPVKKVIESKMCSAEASYQIPETAQHALPRNLEPTSNDPPAAPKSTTTSDSAFANLVTDYENLEKWNEKVDFLKKVSNMAKHTTKTSSSRPLAVQCLHCLSRVIRKEQHSKVLIAASTTLNDFAQHQDDLWTADCARSLFESCIIRLKESNKAVSSSLHQLMSTLLLIDTSVTRELRKICEIKSPPHLVNILSWIANHAETIVAHEPTLVDSTILLAIHSSVAVRELAGSIILSIISVNGSDMVGERACNVCDRKQLVTLNELITRLGQAPFTIPISTATQQIGASGLGGSSCAAEPSARSPYVRGQRSTPLNLRPQTTPFETPIRRHEIPFSISGAEMYHFDSVKSLPISTLEAFRILLDGPTESLPSAALTLAERPLQGHRALVNATELRTELIRPCLLALEKVAMSETSMPYCQLLAIHNLNNRPCSELPDLIPYFWLSLNEFNNPVRGGEMQLRSRAQRLMLAYYVAKTLGIPNHNALALRLPKERSSSAALSNIRELDGIASFDKIENDFHVIVADIMSSNPKDARLKLRFMHKHLTCRALVPYSSNTFAAIWQIMQGGGMRTASTSLFECCEMFALRCDGKLESLLANDRDILKAHFELLLEKAGPAPLRAWISRLGLETVLSIIPASKFATLAKEPVVSSLDLIISYFNSSKLTDSLTSIVLDYYSTKNSIPGNTTQWTASWGSFINYVCRNANVSTLQLETLFQHISLPIVDYQMIYDYTISQESFRKAHGPVIDYVKKILEACSFDLLAVTGPCNCVAWSTDASSFIDQISHHVNAPLLSTVERLIRFGSENDMLLVIEFLDRICNCPGALYDEQWNFHYCFYPLLAHCILLQPTPRAIQMVSRALSSAPSSWHLSSSVSVNLLTVLSSVASRHHDVALESARIVALGAISPSKICSWLARELGDDTLMDETEISSSRFNSFYDHQRMDVEPGALKTFCILIMAELIKAYGHAVTRDPSNLAFLCLDLASDNNLRPSCFDCIHYVIASLDNNEGTTLLTHITDYNPSLAAELHAHECNPPGTFRKIDFADSPMHFSSTQNGSQAAAADDIIYPAQAFLTALSQSDRTPINRITCRDPQDYPSPASATRKHPTIQLPGTPRVSSLCNESPMDSRHRHACSPFSTPAAVCDLADCAVEFESGSAILNKRTPIYGSNSVINPSSTRQSQQMNSGRNQQTISQGGIHLEKFNELVTGSSLDMDISAILGGITDQVNRLKAELNSSTAASSLHNLSVERMGREVSIASDIMYDNSRHLLSNSHPAPIRGSSVLLNCRRLLSPELSVIREAASTLYSVIVNHGNSKWLLPYAPHCITGTSRSLRTVFSKTTDAMFASASEVVVRLTEALTRIDGVLYDTTPEQLSNLFSGVLYAMITTQAELGNRVHGSLVVHLNTAMADHLMTLINPCTAACIYDCVFTNALEYGYTAESIQSNGNCLFSRLLRRYIKKFNMRHHNGVQSGSTNIWPEEAHARLNYLRLIDVVISSCLEIHVIEDRINITNETIVDMKPYISHLLASLCIYCPCLVAIYLRDKKFRTVGFSSLVCEGYTVMDPPMALFRHWLTDLMSMEPESQSSYADLHSSLINGDSTTIVMLPQALPRFDVESFINDHAPDTSLSSIDPTVAKGWVQKRTEHFQSTTDGTMEIDLAEKLICAHGVSKLHALACKMNNEIYAAEAARFPFIDKLDELTKQSQVLQ